MSKALSILVVDDEADIVEFLASEFEYQGYKVYSACCGCDAIELLKKHQVDVIVSDYKMPNGNGMTVLDFSRQIESPPRFYFISGMPELSVEECLEKGASKFFHKPSDIDELITAVANLNK